MVPRAADFVKHATDAVLRPDNSKTTCCCKSFYFMSHLRPACCGTAEKMGDVCGNIETQQTTIEQTCEAQTAIDQDLNPADDATMHTRTLSLCDT